MMIKRSITMIIMLLLLMITACGKQGKSEKIKERHIKNRDQLVQYYDRAYEKILKVLKRRLDLTPAQIEHFGVLKDTGMQQIPEVKLMYEDIRASLITLLETDDPAAGDVITTLDEFDPYNRILRDTVIAQVIGTHAALDRDQREKLARIVDNYCIYVHPPKPPVLIYSGKNERALYKELKITREQKKIVLKYHKVLRKQMLKRRKELLTEAQKQKTLLQETILSENIEITDVDTNVDYIISLFEKEKEIVVDFALELHKSLNGDQKRVLIDYLRELEII